jgi:hypothetical protein
MCASWLAQKGVSLYTVQHFPGREGFQITQRYAHLQPEPHKPVEGAGLPNEFGLVPGPVLLGQAVLEIGVDQLVGVELG